MVGMFPIPLHFKETVLGVLTYEVLSWTIAFCGLVLLAGFGGLL